MQEEKQSELWELVGDRWRLPIVVRWEEGFAVIELAKIPMLEAQRKVALETLEPMRNNNFEFVASKEILEKSARKSKFTNAEDVVEWRHAVAPAVHFRNPHVDEFLDAFVAKGSCPSRPVMSAIYSMLCAHMLQWLLQGKPLPLCFATIYPILYRRNWKELTHHKLDGKLQRDEEQFIVMNGIGIKEAETPERGRKTHIAAWSLNLVHEKMFHEASALLESKYRQRVDYDSEKYWACVRRRLRTQFEYARLCYAEYKAAVREAGISCRKGGKPGPKQSYTRKKHYREDGRLYTLEHLPYWRGKRAETGKCGAVEKKDAGVPPMPGVQPETADVRDTREDVPK